MNMIMTSPLGIKRGVILLPSPASSHRGGSLSLTRLGSSGALGFVLVAPATLLPLLRVRAGPRSRPGAGPAFAGAAGTTLVRGPDAPSGCRFDVEGPSPVSVSVGTARLASSGFGRGRAASAVGGVALGASVQAASTVHRVSCHWAAVAR